MGERYYCDVRPGIVEDEMMMWLKYVGMRAPSFLAWEAPHPWAPATRNTFGIVNCVWTEHLTLAVEFAEQFGRAVYINHPPYVPDLTGVPQTRLFGPKHER